MSDKYGPLFQLLTWAVATVVWTVTTVVAVTLAYSRLDTRITVLENDKSRLERIELKVDELRQVIPLIQDHMSRDRDQAYAPSPVHPKEPK